MVFTINNNMKKDIKDNEVVEDNNDNINEEEIVKNEENEINKSGEGSHKVEDDQEEKINQVDIDKEIPQKETSKREIVSVIIVVILIIALIVILALSINKNNENNKASLFPKIEDSVSNITNNNQGDVKLSDVKISSKGSKIIATCKITATNNDIASVNAVLYLYDNNTKLLRGKASTLVENLKINETRDIEISLNGDYQDINQFEVKIEK